MKCVTANHVVFTMLLNQVTIVVVVYVYSMFPYLILCLQ